MPQNMKNINNFTQWKNGSVDVMSTSAITQQNTSRSLGTARGVQWTFLINSAYLLKNQSENKKLSWNVWIWINQPVLLKCSLQEIELRIWNHQELTLSF